MDEPAARPGDRMMRVLAMPDLTFQEKAVLAAIAFHDGNGGAWPSDETLALETGIKHRQAVALARRQLRDKGRLEWSNGRTTNRYTVHYDCPEIPDSQTGSHCPEKRDSVTPHRTLSGNSMSHCPEIPDTNRKEPESREGRDSPAPPSPAATADCLAGRARPGRRGRVRPGVLKPEAERALRAARANGAGPTADASRK